MLKKFIVTMALVGVATVSYGQGTVNFETANIGAPARVFQPRSTNPVFGNNWFAQLYAAAVANAPEATLLKVGTQVNFRGTAPTSTSAGYVQTFGTTSKGAEVNPVVTVTPTAGGPATVQLRAWSAAFDTYELAAAALLANNPAAHVGESAVLSLSATGGGGEPPALPVNLTGLTGKEGPGITLRDVPEPSTVALGVLGAAALLFARRRK
jgi:hypothetical protein